MSEPMMTCRTCGRYRSCLLHRLSEHPPTAARRWLEHACGQEAALCEIQYLAGIEPGLSLPGQVAAPQEETP